jgi:5-methylcytosine-specific restriction protein A
MHGSQRSQEAREWRGWYNLARWKGKHGRRAQQLSAEPLCRMCAKAGRTTAATVADHIVPHKGDPKLFWEGKLQSLCDADPWRCHSSRKQQQEAVGFTNDVGEDGMPTDPMHPWNRAGGG